MTSSSPSRKFFIGIRHRPTGALLPNVRGYGFTREEPSHDKPPRLFEKVGPAKQALSRWLEGELYEKSSSEDDGEINLALIRRPDRKASEMELVDIEVIVRTFDEAKLRLL